MLRLFSSAASQPDRTPGNRLASAVTARFRKLDINCDLGEGESPAKLRALIKSITSANIACGGHAGDLRSMDQCVRIARSEVVNVGAHPSYWDRENFGRVAQELSPVDFEMLLIHQIGGFERVAAANRMTLHHIKLHGALYHAVERESALAMIYLECVARFWPKARVFALAGGHVAEAAERHGVKVWEEIFADRAYNPDGTLVDRKKEGAMLTKVDDVVGRLLTFTETGRMKTIAGSSVGINARTVCVHSDSENSLRIAKALSEELG